MASQDTYMACVAHALGCKRDDILPTIKRLIDSRDHLANQLEDWAEHCEEIKQQLNSNGSK